MSSIQFSSICPELAQVLPGCQEDVLHQIIHRIQARDEPPLHIPINPIRIESDE